MSTYRDNGNHDFQSPKCDDCSEFDAEGFARYGRSWTPIWGAPCEQCGEDA